MDSIDESLAVLGLDSNATLQDINQAYRDLAIVWHPDRFLAESRVRCKAEAALKKINAAYQILQRYDSASRNNSGRQSTEDHQRSYKHSERNDRTNQNSSESSIRRQPRTTIKPPGILIVAACLVTVCLILNVLKVNERPRNQSAEGMNSKSGAYVLVPAVVSQPQTATDYQFEPIHQFDYSPIHATTKDRNELANMRPTPQHAYTVTPLYEIEDIPVKNSSTTLKSNYH